MSTSDAHRLYLMHLPFVKLLSLVYRPLLQEGNDSEKTSSGKSIAEL